MNKYASFLLAVFICGTLISCSNKNANSGMPLASIDPAAQAVDSQPHSDIVPSGEITYSDAKKGSTNIADVKVTEAEATTEKPSISGGSYMHPKNLEDFFATTYCVVYGTVADIKEYHKTTVDEYGTERERYFSGISFEVEKSYGGDEELSGKTIGIYNYYCSRYDPGQLYAELKVGGKYFLCLFKTERHYDDEAYKEIVKMFPYYLTPAFEAVSEQVGTGYNGAILDALADGTYEPDDLSVRPVKKCSKKHIENIIKANIKNMKGMTLTEFFIENPDALY